MKIKFEVFSVVSPCSFVVGYQSFGGPSYLHLQCEVFHKWLIILRKKEEGISLNNIHMI